jgi:DegV family protein with EDD domain
LVNEQIAAEQLPITIYQLQTMIKIVTDSTGDLAPEVVQQLGISVVPMVVNIDGRDLLDGVDISREQFYAGLPTYRDFPKTAANSPAALADAYRAARAQGTDEIISVHIARKVSGVCAAADVAAADMKDEGINVHVFDSGSMSLGLGWLAVKAAEMAHAGASSRDILAALEDQRRRTRIFAMVDTMKYLRKGGRVSAMTAAMGELLQVKVLIRLSDSEITQIDKVRTRSRGIERLIQEARNTPGPIELHSILRTGGKQAKDLAMLEQAVADLGPKQPEQPTLVTPIIGTHIGPLGLGVLLISKA